VASNVAWNYDPDEETLRLCRGERYEDGWNQPEPSTAKTGKAVLWFGSGKGNGTARVEAIRATGTNISVDMKQLALGYVSIERDVVGEEPPYSSVRFEDCEVGKVNLDLTGGGLYITNSTIRSADSSVTMRGSCGVNVNVGSSLNFPINFELPKPPQA